jgi:hypothetical protein
MQMSLIRRGFEKSSIQHQLIQHEQKLEGARWRFQVRFLVFLSPPLTWERATEHDRDQLSLSIETRYALGALGGALSNNPPRIVDQGVIANPIGRSTAPSPLAGYPSKCSISNFEVVNRFRGHGSSFVPVFLAIIKADLEGPQPESESPSPTIPTPTEEGEFLVNVIGNTDEFGVRPCCLLSRLPSNQRVTSFADIINPKSSSAGRIVKPLAGLQDRQMQKYVVEK